MKLKLSLLTCFCIIFSLTAQQFQLSDNAEISVLTIGPGDALSDSFGHNGFRVKDLNLGIDAVYGYGDYDFDAPYFLLKFTQGKLDYLISRHNYLDITNHYRSYNRSIQEQVLNLTSGEKQKLFNYLENNYKPENRKYAYDFFYDNCATRIRDITQSITENKIDFLLPNTYGQKTFRGLIHEHVGLNTWGSFGIDIALGSVIDTNASPTEYMFLPKYINLIFDNSQFYNSKELIQKSNIIFKKEETKVSSKLLFSPLVIMSLIGLIILFITYKDYKNSTRTRWLDFVIFLITGAIGIILLLLWFATDHTATAQNYNVLWAVPLNLFVIGQLFREEVKIWFKSYLKFLIIMLSLMTLHWIIGVQVFTLGLIPIMLALVIRYIYLVRYFNKK